MKLGKVLLIGVAVLALLAAGTYAARKTILLHALGLMTDLQHPRQANHPVPWQAGPGTAPTGPRPPNVVVIMADDLGFNDVSTFGGGLTAQGVPTPNIDAISQAGVRFDQGYASAAVCSPSRAALLTGRYASRFGFEFTPTPGAMAKVAPMLELGGERLREVITHPEVTDRIASFNELGVPASEITLAEMLKTRGYHTVHLGKWHLGGTPEMRPNNQGFDESLYMESGLYLPEDDPNVVNAKIGFDPIDAFLWPNMRFAVSYNEGRWFEPRNYLTDYLTDEAVTVIQQNRHQPFFIYLAHWGVHTPMQAAKADYDALSSIADHTERVHAAMVRALDRSVGKVLQALRDEGLEDNTIVIFTSDNGGPGYVGLPQLNKPFRGWKLTQFEGGLRVPFVAQWPGHIAPGSRYLAPVTSRDILPTVVAAAGGQLPTDRPLDGVNLLPYLATAAPLQPPRNLFWRDGSYQAVRAGDWKLQQAARPDKVWLYNLQDDPTEQHNLATAQPAKVVELQALLAAHNAQMQPPAWPSFIEMPVMVDKTLAQPEAAEDEYVYWQN
ncbi:MAG: sulfatase [Pseudomonas sp.]|uniref:sulfatase n=1 Tax=Pseudomonas sp. TaxID=306 RepID=UPI0027354F9D|nr:sulfatase [Pseudomonas sp.]MDP3846520.1 sulfatase [Pseudomonas sp.]